MQTFENVSLYETFVIFNPTLSPSTVHLAFDARSWGVVHSPPVQMLNCVSSTHSKCPSVHELSSEALLDAPAADAVTLATAEVSGCGDSVDADPDEATRVVRVLVTDAVLVVALPVPEADAAGAEEDAEPPLLLAVEFPLRGFPSHGCLKRLSSPLG